MAPGTNPDNDLSELIDGARYWQRRRRVLWAAIAFVVVVALAGGIAIGVLRSSRGPVDVSASLTKAGVFHYAVESTTEVASSLAGSGQLVIQPMLVNLASGQRRPIEKLRAYWYDPVRRRLYTEQIVDGTRIAKSTQGFLAVSGPPAEIIVLDELSTLGIRRVLESGDGTRAGGGVLYGRSVSWLRFQSSELSFEVAIDLGSGQPIAIRSVCPVCATRPEPQRLVEVGHVDVVPGRFSVTPNAPGGALRLPEGGVSSRSEPTPLAFSEVAHELAQPALYVGKVVDGLKLHSTERIVTTNYLSNSKREGRSRSLEFDYGSRPLARRTPRQVAAVPAGQVLHRPPSVTIIESTTASVSGGFYKANGHVVAIGLGVTATPIPPQGEALLTSLSPAASMTELWLRRGGLYITIQASSPKLAIDAARHLRLVPHS